MWMLLGWLLGCAPSGLEAWGAPGLRDAMRGAGLSVEGCVTDAMDGMTRVQCQATAEGRVVRAMWARFDRATSAQALVHAGGGHAEGRSVLQVEVHDVAWSEQLLPLLGGDGVGDLLRGHRLRVGACSAERCEARGQGLHVLVARTPGTARSPASLKEGVWSLDDGQHRWLVDAQRPDEAVGLLDQLGGR